MKITIKSIVFSTAISFFLCSCATVPGSRDTMEQKEESAAPVYKKEVVGDKVISRTEEEQKSLEVFNQILELVESTDNRKAVLPRIEGIYRDIIKEYPQTPLAQESYWKLITIYLNDYSPPEYEKSEDLYREFLKKYPKSVLKIIVTTTIANSYYKNKEWKGLTALCAPILNNYNAGGGSPNALLMYMCADADFYLGNLDNAERTYKDIIKQFPKARVGQKAMKMIGKIEETRK